MQAERCVRAGSLFDVSRKAWVPLVMDVRVSPYLMRAVPGEEPVAYYNLGHKGTTARITTISRWRCIQLSNDEDAIYLWCRDEEELRSWHTAFQLAVQHYATSGRGAGGAGSSPSEASEGKSSSGAHSQSEVQTPSLDASDAAAPRVISELPARFHCMQELKLYATPTRLYLVGRVPDGFPLPHQDHSSCGVTTPRPLFRVLEFDRTVARPNSLGEIMKEHSQLYCSLEIGAFVAALYGGGAGVSTSSTTSSSGGSSSAAPSRRPSIATFAPHFPLPSAPELTPEALEDAIATAAATATPTVAAKGSAPATGKGSAVTPSTSAGAAPAPAPAPAASGPPTPPTVLTQDVAALLGAVQFTRGFYLVVVTARRPVGSLGIHPVFGIDASELVPIHYDAPPHTKSTWTRLQERFAASDAGAVVEGRYQSLFLHLDLTKDFFFSYSYDLTRTLQSQVVTRVGQAVTLPVEQQVAAAEAAEGVASDSPLPLLSSSAAGTGLAAPAAVCRVLPREAFLWNGFLAEELQGNATTVSTDWIVPVIHGFFDQRAVQTYGLPTLVTLLARRSRHYAGTRYLKRGATSDGHVANDVEVEQIVDDTLGHFSSYVQMRGSIPVPWMQRTNITLPKPPIVLQPKDLGFNAAKRHFGDMLERYGAPLLVLNLVKKKERHPREKLIGREFGRAVAAANAQLPPPAAVQYLAVDYSALVKARKYNVLAALRDTARWTASNTGFFCTGVVPRAHLHRRRLAVALRRHRLVNQWRAMRGQPAAGLEGGVPRPVPLFRSSTTTGAEEQEVDTPHSRHLALLDVTSLLEASATGATLTPAYAALAAGTEGPVLPPSAAARPTDAALGQAPLPPPASLMPWAHLLKDTKAVPTPQQPVKLSALAGEGSTSAPVTLSSVTTAAANNTAIVTARATGRPASVYLGTGPWVLPTRAITSAAGPEFVTAPAAKVVSVAATERNRGAKTVTVAAPYFSALCGSVATPAVAVADAVTLTESAGPGKSLCAPLPGSVPGTTTIPPGLQVGVPVHLMGCQPLTGTTRGTPASSSSSSASASVAPSPLSDADLSDVGEGDSDGEEGGADTPAARAARAQRAASLARRHGLAKRYLESNYTSSSTATFSSLGATTAGSGALGGFHASGGLSAAATPTAGTTPLALSHTAPALVTASGQDPDATPAPTVHPGITDPTAAAEAARSLRSVWCNNDLQEAVLQQAMAGQVSSALVVNTTSGLAVRLREYESVAGHGEYCYVNLKGTEHGYHSEPLIPAITSVGDLKTAVQEWVPLTPGGSAYPAHESGATPGTTPLPPFRAFPALGLRLQSGVLRTNCVDCMDRTNVGQVCVGVHVLGLQMHALGLSDNETLDPSGCLVELMMTMYEALGDHIALQYGGSEANKKVTTAEHAAAVRVNEGYDEEGAGRRKGGRPVSGYGSDSGDEEGEGEGSRGGGGGSGGGSGASGSSLSSAFNLFGTSGSSAVSVSFGGTTARPSRLGGNPATELLSSLQRYYANSFTDSIKQAAINLFLGVFQPRLHSDPLWELETDYFLHNSDLTRLAGVADAEERAGASSKAAAPLEDCTQDWWTPRLRKFCITGLPRVEAVLPTPAAPAAAAEPVMQVTAVDELVTSPAAAPPATDPVTPAEPAWTCHVARGVGGPILSQAADATSLTLFDELLALPHVAPFGSSSGSGAGGSSGSGGAAIGGGGAPVDSAPLAGAGGALPGPKLQGPRFSPPATVSALSGNRGLGGSGNGMGPAATTTNTSPQRLGSNNGLSGAPLPTTSPSRPLQSMSAAPLRLQTVRREGAASSTTASGPAVPAIPPRGLNSGGMQSPPSASASASSSSATASTAAADKENDASTTRDVATDDVLARGGVAAGRPLSAAFSIYGPLIAAGTGGDAGAGADGEGEGEQEEAGSIDAGGSRRSSLPGASSRRSSLPGGAEDAATAPGAAALPAGPTSSAASGSHYSTSSAPVSRSRLPPKAAFYSSDSNTDGEAYELSLFADALPGRRKALPPKPDPASLMTPGPERKGAAARIAAGGGTQPDASKKEGDSSETSAATAPPTSATPSLVFGALLASAAQDGQQSSLPQRLHVDSKQYPGVSDAFVLRRQDACGDLLFDTEVAAGGGEGVTSGSDLERYGRYVDLAWTVGPVATGSEDTTSSGTPHSASDAPPRKSSANNPFNSPVGTAHAAHRALTTDATRHSSAAAVAARDAALYQGGLPRVRAQVVSSLAEVDIYKRAVARGTQPHTDTQDIESNRRWQAEHGLTVDIVNGPFVGLPRNRLLAKLLAPSVAAEQGRREREAVAAVGGGAGGSASLLEAPAQPVPVLIFGTCL